MLKACIIVIASGLHRRLLPHQAVGPWALRTIVRCPLSSSMLFQARSGVPIMLKGAWERCTGKYFFSDFSFASFTQASSHAQLIVSSSILLNDRSPRMLTR